jgi:hypothetical protein
VAAIGVVLGAVVLGQALSEQRRERTGDSAVPGVVDRQHCGGTRAASIDDALRTSAFDVVLPANTLARDETLAAVWDCPGTATLLEFSSEVTVVVDENTIADPERSWQGVAESNPEVYSVGTVQGVPALLIDPAADSSGTANGGVTFVLQNVYVSVGGNGEIPLAELVDVASGLSIT